MKKILYIHGLKRGTGNTESQTATSLRRVLDKDRYSVIAPRFSTNGEEALNLARKIIREEQIEIVIGSSLGGFITLCLRGIPKIVINPCVRPDLELPKRGNSAITQSYSELVGSLWDNITPEEQEQTIGVFSDKDELFSYRDEFLQHYPKVLDIEDGHRISEHNIHQVVVSIIKEL